MVQKALGYLLNLLIIAAALLAWCEHKRELRTWGREPQTGKPYEW